MAFLLEYRLNVIGAIVTGILLTGTFPNIGLEWLSWFALVPLLFSIRNHPFRESFRLGILAGLVHFFTLLYWVIPFLITFGNLPYCLALPVHFLLAAFLALYIGVFSGVLSLLRLGPVAWFIFSPFLWVSLEYIRGILLSGFPWELMGYSQFNNLHLIQISDILGVYGVSFLILMVNGTVFLLLLLFLRLKWQNKYISWASVAGVCVVTTLAIGGSLYYGKWRINFFDNLHSPDAYISAAIVQGNIDQHIKWDPESRRAITEKYTKLSASAKTYNPDLIVWPETATPFYFGYDADFTKMVLEAVVDAKTSFLFGSPSFVPTNDVGEYYNSAYLIGPDGELKGRYDKVHLVPFGEYVPGWLPFVNKIVAEVGDFRTGIKGRTLPWNGENMGVQICYEIIFPVLSRALVKNDATLLLNITNDAWYGKSGAPIQHFSMAIFRAVENKRSLIRSANTGISGFIDPVGRILSATKTFEDAVISHEVPRVHLKTIYTRFGDWFALVCLGISGLVFLIKIMRRE